MLGKPAIRGTRITVELILERKGNGFTVEDILREYPFLTAEQVRVALLFGGRAPRAPYVYPNASSIWVTDT